MDRVGWIRGEWHSRKDNHLLAGFLAQTHIFHIDPNPPHSVGMFVAHRVIKDSVELRIIHPVQKPHSEEFLL